MRVSSPPRNGSRVTTLAGLRPTPSILVEPKAMTVESSTAADRILVLLQDLREFARHQGAEDYVNRINVAIDHDLLAAECGHMLHVLEWIDDRPRDGWSLAFQDTRTERTRQDAKWGAQNHQPETWLAILSEELGEMAREILLGSWDNLRSETVQVAAVAVAFVEAMDRTIAKEREAHR
jgi:NTP pyrophosphatase (non-canonical NTP hydrolase)